MNAADIDLGVFVRLHNKLTGGLRKTEDAVAKSSDRMNKRLSLSMKLAGAGAVATAIAAASKAIVVSALEPVRAVQRAQGELASLGVENIALVTDMGKKMQRQYAGVTADAFVLAAYDIRSGISSLTDEGVAEMTRAATIVAKATKAVPEQMTSLFATSFGIFRDQYEQLSDADFGTKFGDMLSASVQQFKTDGTQMQAAIESAGKSATNMGLRMSEQLTILGQLQATMSGSEAGTALKAFAANSARADAAFGKMQITAENPVRIRILDENNMMRSVPDILADMTARYGDTLDAAERFEIQQALGSEEAIKLVDTLYGQSGALRDNANALEQAGASGGVYAENMAKLVDNNWDSKIDLYSQKIDVIKMSIGEGMLPVLEAAEPAITAITDAVVGFMEANPLAAQIIGFTVIALAGIASIAAPILLGMAAMTIAAPSLAIAFGAVGTALGVVGGAIKAVTLALLSNPIILIIAAIAAAAYLIYDNWDAISAFFSEIWDQIRVVWEPVSAWFSSLWDTVKDVFSGVFTFLKALVMTFTPVGIIYKHWDGISAFFSGVWDNVKSVFSSLFEWAVSAFLNFTPAGLIYTHWDSISAFFDGIWDSTASAFDVGIEAARYAVLNFTPAGLIYTHWDGISAWFSSIWTGVTAVFTGVWSVIQSAAEGNFNPANIIYDRWNAISAWFAGLWGKVTAVFSGAWASIKGMASAWPAQMRGIGSNIISGLVAGIRAAPGAVWSALKSVVMGGVNRVKSFLGIKSPSRLFMGIGSNVTDGLALGVAGGQPRVDAQMASMARRMEVPIRPVLRPSFMARAGRVVRRVAAPLAMAAGAQVAMPAAATIAPPVSVADVAGAGPDSGMTEASPPRERLSEMRGLLRSVVLSPRYDIKIDLGSIKDLDEAAIRRLFEDLLREHDRELEALLRRALHD